MTRIAVVGGGAAGAVLAARLSDKSTNEVTLIEAGSASTPHELLAGSAIPAAVPGHPANWSFAASLLPARETVVPRGKILGGSSAINGGYFVRARREDFARWAAVAGTQWQYDAALKLLIDLETDLDFSGAPGHGAAGWMRLRRPPLTGQLAAAFVAAARELGHELEPDKNAAQPAATRPPLGVGAVPSNIIDGTRINTAHAFLSPVLKRENLRLLTDTRALRIAIESHNTTGQLATGVHTDRGFIAADEVVLCAGAVATAQLLLLSGVGPASELAAHGITVRADLPVGQGFSDHPNIAVGWMPQTAIDHTAAPFPAVLNFASDQAKYPEGDLEVLLVAKPIAQLFDAAARPTPGAPGYEHQLLVALQLPRSTGTVALVSADPLTPPRIEYNYLQDAHDRDRMRLGVRKAAAMLQSKAFAKLFGGFTALDSQTLASDALLDNWIAAHLGTAIHMCGTAALGKVTTGDGLVHGVAGLRVADTSLLPSVPSRGTFNTAVFIGAHIAATMCRD